MENYKEQYTNKKKKTKELKLKWLRTASHVGYSGHRPVRKITIELIYLIKCCSNRSITRLQQQEKKETKNKYQKGRRKLENNILV